MSALWEQMPEPDAAEALIGSMVDEWVAPPFSVLDTRQGYWKERRDRWLSLGIQSELGRGAGVNTFSPQELERSGGWSEHPQHRGLLSKAAEREGMGGDYDLSKGENAWGGSGTSIFDPVLCELAYRWWSPAGGRILDPFAGGSVRGIVAAVLGHPYTGIDLSAAQIEANRAQAARILTEGQPMPEWIVGDSSELATLLPAGQKYDMVFTCPPYYDLEVYSSDERDLSVKRNYADFVAGYQAILAAAVARLQRDRFAVVVVSEIRDKRGLYRGFVPDTVAALEQAGAGYYNEAILVNSVGSLPLRAGKYMRTSRKLGRTHQKIIVGLHGEPDSLRHWDAERVAPPSPQQALWMTEPEPAAVPTPALEVASPAVVEVSLPPAEPDAVNLPPDGPEPADGPGELVAELEAPADEMTENDRARYVGAFTSYINEAEADERARAEPEPPVATPAPPWVYVLELEDLARIESAVASREAAIAGVPERYRAPNQTRAQSKHMGASGELALHKLTGQPWHSESDPLHHPDVGIYEVRTRRGHLPVYEWDGTAAIFVLVSPDDQLTRRAAGWIVASDARRDEWWRHELPQPAWWVPEAALRPMSELPRVAPRPLTPASHPSPNADSPYGKPPPDMLEVRMPAGGAPGTCEQCGEVPGPGHEHAPFTTPEQAAALFETGVWSKADATAEDAAAMREAGLWE